jgi:hypothetical protein
MISIPYEITRHCMYYSSYIIKCTPFRYHVSVILLAILQLVFHSYGTQISHSGIGPSPETLRLESIIKPNLSYWAQTDVKHGQFYTICPKEGGREILRNPGAIRRIFQLMRQVNYIPAIMMTTGNKVTTSLIMQWRTI